MNRAWLMVAGALAASGLIATALPAHAQARPDLSVAVNGLPVKLDPADNPLAVDLRVTTSVFDTLIKRDFLNELRNPEKGTLLVPSLATEWRRIDARTLELKLRQGVKFHNGDEFTADDVLYTFSAERIFGPKAFIPSAVRYLGEFESVQAVDKYTVRITAKLPDPVLEYRLATFGGYIVSKRAYAELGFEKFKRAPVGTGPLKFVEWKSGSYMKFAAHDDYFGGRPNFNSVTFTEVPEVSARVAGLLSGSFDMITQLDPDQIDTIRGRAGLSVAAALLEQPQMLYVWGEQPGVRNPLVRQALAISIDRDRITEKLLGGMTTPELTFQLPSFGALYSADRQGFKYDPERAKRLLKEGGYQGEPVVLRIVGNYYAGGEVISQAMQSMWQAVGINAKLEIVENFNQAYAAGRAVVLGGCSYVMPTPEGIAPCFFAPNSFEKQRGFPKGVANLDEIAGGLASAPTVAERAKIFGKIQDVLEAEVPGIPLYRIPQIFGVKKSVAWTAYPELGMDFRPVNLSIQK
jgi:peptide/nickel transport system substrate-binding protein